MRGSCWGSGTGGVASARVAIGPVYLCASSVQSGDAGNRWITATDRRGIQRGSGLSNKADDWGEGYVTGVEYVSNFHPGLVPSNLAAAALLAGIRPPDLDRAFAYLDLGCGNGFTPALVAAANPHAQIWGNDFLPAHIRNARATADAAGLDNAHFVEASFADLLDRDLPQFDLVVAHGIWSWVSQANRERIAALLARHVAPGGLVMVSYNCHPGWDSLLPLRRLLFTAAGQDGGPIERVERALATARRLCDAGADYFRNAPAAVVQLEHLERADRAYVAHEYLNEQWTLFQPAEVAAELAAAGLTYFGQGRIGDNNDIALAAGQRSLLADIADTGVAQEMRDLMLDRRFRHDLFVREGTPLGEQEQAAWLVRPRAECPLERGAEPLDAVLDALAQRVMTGKELAAATGGDSREALGTLLALGHVQLALGETGEPARRAATERFTAAALASMRMGEPFAALASPVAGAGVPLSAGDQMLLDAWRIGIPLEAITLRGSDPAANRVAAFRDALLPMLQRLGIA